MNNNNVCEVLFFMHSFNGKHNFAVAILAQVLDGTMCLVGLEHVSFLVQISSQS